MSRSDIKAGSAFVELLLRDKQFLSGLRKSQDQLKHFGKGLKEFGSLMATAGAAIVTPFVAAIKMAGDAQETISRFKAVFAEQAGYAEAFATDLAKSVGRAATEIKGSLASFQAFFVGLGFGAEESRKFSEQLQALSIDFASFNNMSDAEAAQRFISALSGSSEVLDMYGINIKQAALEQELLRTGITKSWTEVTEQEKSVARLSIIMRSMGDQGAVGDAVRTAGSFANQAKRLRGELVTVAESIGNALLPPVTQFIQKANVIVGAIGEWVAVSPEAITQIAGMGAAFVATGAAAYGLGAAFTFLATHPIIAILATIAAGAYAIAAAYNEARDSVTDYDRAQRGLGQKRTLGDSDTISALITRFDQLSAKAKLSIKEQKEAHAVIRDLRLEFGFGLNAGLANDGSGRITGADAFKAKLNAARGGRSAGLQKLEITQAEMAMGARRREGADPAELKQRAEALTAMKEALAASERIIADAKATATGTAPGTTPATEASKGAKAFGDKFFDGIRDSFEAGSEAVRSKLRTSPIPDIQKGADAGLKNLRETLAMGMANIAAAKEFNDERSQRVRDAAGNMVDTRKEIFASYSSAALAAMGQGGGDKIDKVVSVLEANERAQMKRDKDMLIAMGQGVLG